MNALVRQEANALAMTDDDVMKVLQTSLYPGASPDSIRMVMGYCRAAGLDPMQKPVHIVPMWDNNARVMRDVVMPGIGLYRTQAARTGCAGVTEPEFGPDITEDIGGVTVTYPAWCRVTVKRLLSNGQVVDFTAKEFWKENYAAKGGKEKSIAPNAMWQKRPYGQLAKCFDPETEVLTTAGFERFDKVTGRILQVGALGLEPVEATPFSQDWDGDMIVADGTRLNFAVTPNHDMLTTAGKIEAANLYKLATKDSRKLAIPRAPQSTRSDAPVSDAVLRLLGYFLADGSHTGYRQFRICVSRDYKIDLLRELSLHQREGIKADAGRIAQAGERKIVTTADKVVFTYEWDLLAAFVSPEKELDVGVLLTLSARQARVVVDALLEFDGSDNGCGVRRLTQANEAVLRGFEVAAVHAGYSISARAERASDIGRASSITVSDAAHFPVVRGVEKNSASLNVRRNESGRVWCVTVPSGIIVVRRHGFSMLCGNCAEAQALRKGFPEVGNAPTADEMMGKAINEFAEEARATLDAARHEEPTITFYPSEQFDQNLPAWRKAIADGKRTADQIIQTVETKGRLSEEQKNKIRQAGTIDAETGEIVGQ